jgi:hypothetical protein
MGLLTELFVAADGDAKTYDHASGDRQGSVKLGGLTNLEFEMLWAVLSGEDWNPDVHGLTEVASSESTWTFKFPQAYVEALRRLDGLGISRAAKLWAATEELSCEPAELEPAIRKLVSLALSLDDRRDGLFVWTSL